MPAKDIDDYLAAVDEPKRSTLETVRTRILEIVPDAEQGLSYGAPVEFACRFYKDLVPLGP